jgi:chitinase
MLPAEVSFYYNCNYDKLMATIGLGRYTAAMLRERQLNGYTFDNNLRSMRLPPNSHKVTIYENDNFQGRSLTFTSDVPCLDAYSFNDQTSSITIGPAGEGEE